MKPLAMASPGGSFYMGEIFFQYPVEKVKKEFDFFVVSGKNDLGVVRVGIL